MEARARLDEHDSRIGSAHGSARHGAAPGDALMSTGKTVLSPAGLRVLRALVELDLDGDDFLQCAECDDADATT